MGARFCHSIFQPKNLIVDLGELIEETAAAKEELFGFLVPLQIEQTRTVAELRLDVPGGLFCSGCGGEHFGEPQDRVSEKHRYLG